MKIALAAVKLAHLATCGEHDDEEIEIVAPRAPAPWGLAGKRPPFAASRGKRQAGPSADMARVYVGAGRAAGIRPQDLVGAIAGESGISGKTIGAIEIEERFSLVELPAAVVDDVLVAMRAALIKGKKVPIRRFVER